MLCELNGVEKPELPAGGAGQWTEEYRRLDNLRLYGFPTFEREAILADEEPRPSLAPASRHKAQAEFRAGAQENQQEGEEEACQAEEGQEKEA